MTYDERIYDLVKKKNEIELTEEAREIVDKAIEIATEINADLEECEAEHKPHTKVVEYLQNQTDYFFENYPKPLKKHLHAFVNVVADVLFANIKQISGNKLYDDMIKRGMRCKNNEDTTTTN